MATNLDFLEPGFKNLAAMAGIFQNLQETQRQNDELAEKKRSNMAEESIKGRANDIADKLRTAQAAHDNLGDALAAMNAGGKGVTTGDDGNDYTPGSGAPVPGAVGVTQGMTAPVDSSRVVSAGGQRQYIPTQDEANSAALQRQVANAQAMRGVSAVQIPDEVRSTLYPGGNGPTTYQPSEGQPMNQFFQDLTNRRTRAEAAQTAADMKGAGTPKTTVTLSKNDATLLGQKEGTEMPIDEYRARATMYSDQARGKRQDAAENASRGVQSRFDANKLGEIEKEKGDALTKSHATLQEDLKKVALQAEKDKVDAPDVAASNRVAGTKQAYSDHWTREQDAQRTYEQRIGQHLGKSIQHQPWADNPPAADPQTGLPVAPKTAAAPAAAPAQAAPKKVTSAPMSKVDEYASKYKLSRADAIRAFQKDGISVGQQ